VPRNNYFLLSAKKIERDLLQKYGVEEIKVTKIFPEKLLIEINKPSLYTYLFSHSSLLREWQ